MVPIWQSPFGAQTYWLPAIGVLGGDGAADPAGGLRQRRESRPGAGPQPPPAGFAVRLALGASRREIVAIVVCRKPGTGGFLAPLAASRSPSFILLPFHRRRRCSGSRAETQVYLDTSVDGYVLGFALGLSCLCALMFGFVPALRKTSRVELITWMNDMSPRMAARGRVRSALVVSQVAVSLVLLIGAGLVMRSYSAAQHADGGFDSQESVTALAIDLQTSGYDEAGGLAVYQPVSRRRLEPEPAFESASLALNMPLSLVDVGVACLHNRRLCAADR